MIKQVLFAKESRDKLLSGVQKIADAVRVTMGGMGKCVLIGNAVYGSDGLFNFPTIVTKDGYTVTKHFELPDAVENRGAMMIKEAAMKTVEQVGDATTCTCVIAESLITGGMKLIEEGANSQMLKKGMDSALEFVISELKKMSVEVKGNNDRIKQVATVSANNDSVIGQLIADAFAKIGDEGVIDLEASQSVNTEIKIADGYKWGNGWISPYFINNKEKQITEFIDPLILLYEKRVTHHTQIERALGIALQQSRPILIICEDAEDEGLAYLATNNIRPDVLLKNMICVVKSPSFGNDRRVEMEDLAILTGGTYISDTKGVSIKEIEFENFGSAKKVTVTKDETIIIDGNSDEVSLENLLNELRMNLTQAKNEDEKSVIEKRIARLTGGVAVIQVGAATETEMKERLDRFDDAVRATKAAISEGFSAGGGTAFLRVSLPILKEENLFQGYNLVFDALEKPILQICINAGLDAEEILSKIKKESGDVGYNVLNDKIENMVNAGVIDATKALRCALINAVSVAGMVLTSECSIVTIS